MFDIIAKNSLAFYCITHVPYIQHSTDHTRSYWTSFIHHWW